MSVCPDRRRIWRRRRQIHEYNTRYFKFHEISTNHRLYMRPDFSRNSPNHIAPASMLTGIELFQHRFSGNPENQCFFLIRKIEPFPGSPFSDHFWRLFFENVYIGLFLAKNQVSKNRIYMRQILRRRRNIFAPDIRPQSPS